METDNTQVILMQIYNHLEIRRDELITIWELARDSASADIRPDVDRAFMSVIMGYESQLTSLSSLGVLPSI